MVFQGDQKLAKP